MLSAQKLHNSSAIRSAWKSPYVTAATNQFSWQRDPTNLYGAFANLKELVRPYKAYAKREYARAAVVSLDHFPDRAVISGEGRDLTIRFVYFIFTASNPGLPSQNTLFNHALLVL
ncbi:hypothetical protein GGP41_004853 [Bipolaris sorokiniana]|uniref:Uncharacterized protein n=1 Tax=Cochliobolus sativus TaxID=45130 RepID=A0A8H6DT47_COCSA|nr:hypothetical protein GGP41_004853 [Bipolaris sorokiniana]